VLGIVVAESAHIDPLRKHVAAKLSEERGFKLWKRAPKEKRVYVWNRQCLVDAFIEQGLGLAWAGRAAEEAILRGVAMKLLLSRKRQVAVDFGYDWRCGRSKLLM
jgi:hypothetical protein